MIGGIVYSVGLGSAPRHGVCEMPLDDGWEGASVGLGEWGQLRIASGIDAGIDAGIGE